MEKRTQSEAEEEHEGKKRKLSNHEENADGVKKTIDWDKPWKFVV